MPEVETKKTPEQKLEAFVTLGEELSKSLEKAEAERKSLGETTEKTGKQVAELTAKFAEAQSEQKEAISSQSESMKALQERVDEMEKKYGRERGDGDPADDFKSPADRFLESDEYKSLVASKGKRPEAISITTLFPGIEWGSNRLLKTALLSSAATRLTMPQRADLAGPQLRQLRMRDLMPVRPTGSNSIEYIREVGFHGNASASLTGITQTSGTATATAAAAHGLAEGDRVLIAGATGGTTAYNGQKIVLSTPTSTTFTFAIDSGATSPATGTLTFTDMEVHGAAAGVSEGSAKPEAELNFELRSETVETIAHWLPASRQILSDEGQMRSYIDDRLRYGVLYAEDVDLLYGTGSSPQIQGFLTETGILTYAWSEGPATTDTKIDAIRRGMTLAHNREFMPDAVVLNPHDWEDIELAKGSDNHYIWINVTTGGERRFFMVPVVVTNAIASGTALTGSFAMGSTLWDREDVVIEVTNSHSDYFTKNLLAIRAEERVAHTIYRPDAYVEITLDSAPSS
jgi:hypothetical protein